MVFENHLLDLKFQNFTSEYGSKFISASFFPKQKCLVPKNKHVAIIIPFRDTSSKQDRTKHLKWLLLYMIPALIRQNIHFRFYVINQGRAKHSKLYKSQQKELCELQKGGHFRPFNRGKLLNIGFQEAVNDGFDCFFFHDVDLVLEDDRNLYLCSRYPRHYAAHIDKWNYKPLYNNVFGGIGKIPEQGRFIFVNTVP